MRHLIQITERVLQIKTSNSTAPTTTTGAPASSRMPLYTSNSTWHIRSMTPPNPQVPQLSTPSFLRVDQSTKTNHKHWTKKRKTKFHTTAPAHNRRSQTQETGPPIRTRECTQLTILEGKKNRTRIYSKCSHISAWKRRPRSFGRHGHRHRQVSQLQATHEKPKI